MIRWQGGQRLLDDHVTVLEVVLVVVATDHAAEHERSASIPGDLRADTVDGQAATDVQPAAQAPAFRLVDVRPTPQGGEHVLDDVFGQAALADDTRGQPDESDERPLEQLVQRRPVARPQPRDECGISVQRLRWGRCSRRMTAASPKDRREDDPPASPRHRHAALSRGWRSVIAGVMVEHVFVELI